MKNVPFPKAENCQGEYRADVTRDTFAPLAGFSRVIAQQGRPVLDADLNEQTSILLHYLRQLAIDLGGAHFASREEPGFEVKVSSQNNPFELTLSNGRYYVDGFVCELAADTTLSGLLLHTGKFEPKAGASYLVYLDVWEQHSTHLQQPAIREAALNGVDTATRAQVVWQVGVASYEGFDEDPSKLSREKFLQFLGQVGVRKPGAAKLTARTIPRTGESTPCLAAPSSRYRGVENQLYRVEVDRVDDGAPQLKWSRENSSVQFRVTSATGATLKLAQWPRDSRSAISPGDWLELVDDEKADTEWVQVKAVDREMLEVTLVEPFQGSSQQVSDGYVCARRWDQRGTQALVAAPFDGVDKDWVKLEQGIEIKLTRNDDAQQAQPGDYWLIPARVATGRLEWPQGEDAAVLPHGTSHHYAPLAYVSFKDHKEWSATDLRALLG